MVDAAGFPRFELRTLGSFGLFVQPDQTSPPTPVVLGEKSCALIAYLWLADRHVARETLCALLWDNIGSSDARNNLRQALFRIRRVLGAEAIQEDGQGLWLAAPHLHVDLAAYQTAQKDGTIPRPMSAVPFAVMRQPMGERFVRWRDAVRRRLGGPSAEGAGEAVAGAESSAERPHPLGQAQVLESLLNAWQLCARGAAMSVCLAAATGARRHDAVRVLRQAFREHGAGVATVSAPPRGLRGKDSLWASVATALWSKPGAMGVAPEHVRLLEDVPGALSVDRDAARHAVLDLVRAVADERPLVIIVEDVTAYASASTEALARAVASMRGTAVLLVLLSPPLFVPPASVCLALNGFGAPSQRGLDAVLRASRQSAG